MPGERYLLLQMHELLGYLNQRGVVTMLVLGQHGIVGEVQTDIDISYLSDVMVLFRYFEHQGEVLTAVAAVKSRGNAHERTIRQFRLAHGGIELAKHCATSMACWPACRRIAASQRDARACRPSRGRR